MPGVPLKQRLENYIPNEISHEISNVKFHEISLVKFSSCFSEISKFCCVEEIGSGRRLFVLDATLILRGLALSLSLSPQQLRGLRRGGGYRGWVQRPLYT